jgi:hypothetical protein
MALALTVEVLIYWQAQFNGFSMVVDGNIIQKFISCTKSLIIKEFSIRF